jgi:carbon-monoxide dehydrogenase large subunit
MERLVDTAAAEMGIDRVELRRRNHILAEGMPYKAPNGTTYDSGEFTAVLDEALAQADWDGFDARKAESRARGLLRGRGIGDYLEVTGPPANEMGGIRFEPEGNVTIITGTLDYGQLDTVRPGIASDTRHFVRTHRTVASCCKATATSWSPAAAPAAQNR